MVANKGGKVLQKYLSTLAIIVAAATYAVSFLSFVTTGAVHSGTAMDEQLRFELTVNDTDGSYHAVGVGPVAQFLSENIRFHATGSAHLLAANVDVTPTRVSVRRAKTVPGAALNVALQWDTLRDARDGANGRIYLDFPQIPGLESSHVHFTRSLGHWTQEGYVILEETAYTQSWRFALARTLLALSLGLPLGILLHAVAWHYLVPAVAEWQAGLKTLWLFAGVTVLILYMSDGLVSQTTLELPYLVVALGAATAPLAAAYRAAYTGARQPESRSPIDNVLLLVAAAVLVFVLSFLA